MPDRCKIRCGLFPETPLDSPDRHCPHDPDPKGYGPFCSKADPVTGFCYQRIPGVA